MRYVINDCLEVEGYSASPEEAEYSAAFNRGTSYSNPRLRIAWVSTTPAIRALVAVANTISSLPLKAFTTLEEARIWAAGGN